MNLNDIVPLVVKYSPAANCVLQLLGEPQKEFIHNNAEWLSPYMQTKEGQEALHLFLVEFAEFVLKQKARNAG